MKKDNIRDYATAAFRFYAAVGSSEKYKEKLWKEALERKEEKVGPGSGISNPTEAQIVHAEKIVDEHIAEIKDLEAVEKTLEMCDTGTTPGRMMKELIKGVYFVNANNPLKKGDIHNRVIATSMELEIRENSAYKILKSARKLFALNRGLRDC